jgi:hypothetical protein
LAQYSADILMRLRLSRMLPVSGIPFKKLDTFVTLALGLSVLNDACMNRRNDGGVLAGREAKEKLPWISESTRSLLPSLA